MSESKHTPTALVMVNVFITMCFLFLATLANHFLLLRDDKTRKLTLLKKIQSRSFNSNNGRGGGGGLIAGGAFKAAKRPATHSMNRFINENPSQQSATQPTGTAVQNNNAPQSAGAHDPSSVGTSLLSQSPPPSPVAVNVNTPLLRPGGRNFQPTRQSGGSFPVTRGSFVGPGNQSDNSSSNFFAAVNQDSNGRQSPPLGPHQPTGSRPPSMCGDLIPTAVVPTVSPPQTYVGRSKYHFVPTESEESSDEDSQVDNGSIADPFPRVASSFVGGNSADTFFGSKTRAGSDRNEAMMVLMQNATACGSVFKSRTKMFSDERSYFFISVIVCCLIEAITMLIFTFADVSTATVGEASRGTQDVISAPQACSMFIVFSVLLHTLHSIVEKLLNDADSGRRIFIAIGTIISSYTIAVSFILAGYSETASEYVSTSLEVILAGTFLWTSHVLPARIRTFGASTEQTATKVRRVCLIAAFSLTVRFVVFFPLLQNKYGSLGEYAASLLNFVDMVPLGVSLMFLHSR
jgi:hypothetical protein